MRTILITLLAWALTACGGASDVVLPPAHAATAAPVEIVHLHAVLRPDSSGRWFIQNDEDHAPFGILLQVEQGPDFVRIFFDRNYTHAGAIHVTADDDFRGTISGYSNLGLNAATIRVVANGHVIDPAAVTSFVPPGAGNFWITVTMLNKGAAQ